MDAITPTRHWAENYTKRFPLPMLHLLLLVVITAGVFSNTLENDYHLDSIHRVAQNTEIDQLWPAGRFFTDIRTGSTVPQIAEYRPMMPLSNALNNELTRLVGITRLAGYHIGNITIHSGSVILVYFLAMFLISRWGRRSAITSQLTRAEHPAFFATLIFAIHPIAGSAVNYIAARDLLLMVFFLLASMLVYMRMRRRGDSIIGWMGSLALLCAAILSKQGAIVAFGLIFLYEWVLHNTHLSDWRLWLRTALFALPTMAFFVLRQVWIIEQNTDDPLRTFNGLSYPLTMLHAHLFYYLRNFVWPFEMRALASTEPINSLLEPGALIGLLFILATLLAAWWMRRRQPLITFSILAYWLLFSLTSSIFPFRYVVTDYRQYLPLVFLSLGLVVWLFNAVRQTWAVGLLSALALYFALASYQINTHWKSEQSFWAQSVKYGAVALAHNNYGLAIKSKDRALAEHHFQEALRQDPDHIYARINLALLYLDRGKQAQGMDLLRQTVRQNPGWALAHYWLARGLSQTGDQEAATRELQQAAELDPRSLKYQHEAAEALQREGRYADSITNLERIVHIERIGPGYQSTGFLLGFAYQKTGQRQKAIETYTRFLYRHPRHMQARFNLAYALMKTDQCGPAIEYFQSVLQLKSDYKEVYLHLTTCYRALGKSAKAEEAMGRYRG